MSITIENAEEIIEEVFDFDHIGNAISAVRRDPDSKEAKEILITELIKHAVEESGENSDESLEKFKISARKRVEQFIKGVKFSQTGCSKFK